MMLLRIAGLNISSDELTSWECGVRSLPLDKQNMSESKVRDSSLFSCVKHNGLKSAAGYYKYRSPINVALTKCSLLSEERSLDISIPILENAWSTDWLVISPKKPGLIGSYVWTNYFSLYGSNHSLPAIIMGCGFMCCSWATVTETDPSWSQLSALYTSFLKTAAI